MGKSGLHERRDGAVQHFLRVGAFNTCAQIFHKLIRLENVGANLVPPADIGLGGIRRIRSLFALFQLLFIERARSMDQAFSRFLCCERSA